jgi:ArsR family transcriptional regulator
MNEKVYSKYFKAMSDVSRLRILGLLVTRDMTVNDLVSKLDLCQPTVSRHLAILRESGILIDRREGQQVFYSLDKKVVEDCCSNFCNCLEISVQKTKEMKKT